VSIDLTCIPGQIPNTRKCCHCMQMSTLFTFQKMMHWIT